MKVSIIIPTYNVESYITECLESVARQTYQGEMECLVVDDCGTDNSIAVADQFISDYQGRVHFRIIHREKNGGLSAARNTGVKNAVGDYVYFLDSDDAIISETIEEMMKVVCDHPQVEMVQGGIVSMNGQVLEDFSVKELPEYTDNIEWIIKNMLFSFPVSSCNRLLKRDFLQRNIISFHEGIIHEDVPYNFLLAIKFRYVGFVKKNTYLYRMQREGSIINSSKEGRSIHSRLLLMKECIDNYTHHRFVTNELQDIALYALWWKWMDYMKIHSMEALSLQSFELSDVLKKLIAITPWPWKLFALTYNQFPIRLKRKIQIKKL